MDVYDEIDRRETEASEYLLFYLFLFYLLNHLLSSCS